MTESTPMRALVAGWFSFEKAGATAGDLVAKRLVCEWLERVGYAYDVALAPPFTGGVDWQSVDPQDYSHVVFVCGPFYKSNLLQRFEKCRLVGINLSMIDPVDSWNPFDLLLERDSSITSRPDITFLVHALRVPVVGVTLMSTHDLGRDRGSYEAAHATIRRFIASREMAAVFIDTRLDIPNTAGLRSPAEIESLIARMDVVLTTRLHGMVFALKNCVPTIAIDPIPGGGNVSRQAETIGWPLVFPADQLTDEALQQAFDYCLTEAVRKKAMECRQRAVQGVEELCNTFLFAMSRSDVKAEGWGDGRHRGTWIVPGASLTPRNSAMSKSVSRLAPISLARHLLSRLKRVLQHTV